MQMRRVHLAELSLGVIIVQAGGQKMWRLLLRQVVKKAINYRYVLIIDKKRHVIWFSLGHKANKNSLRKVLAAFLEKCPEQYTM